MPGSLPLRNTAFLSKPKDSFPRAVTIFTTTVRWKLLLMKSHSPKPAELRWLWSYRGRMLTGTSSICSAVPDNPFLNWLHVSFTWEINTAALQTRLFPQKHSGTSLIEGQWQHPPAWASTCVRPWSVSAHATRSEQPFSAVAFKQAWSLIHEKHLMSLWKRNVKKRSESKDLWISTNCK